MTDTSEKITTERVTDAGARLGGDAVETGIAMIGMMDAIGTVVLDDNPGRGMVQSLFTIGSETAI